MSFPVGATLDNGAIVLMEWLRGVPEIGQYMGVGSKGRCLVTLSSPIRESYAAARRRFDTPLPSMAPVVYIGPLETTEGQYDALVEAMPAGRPGHLLGALSADNALALATSVAHDLAKAHALGVVYAGLRPELVFVEEDEPMRIVVAPRAEAWVALGTQRREGGLLFDRLYSAPEQLKGGLATSASDVFALAGTLAFWLGAKPFGAGQLGAQLNAILTGSPDVSALPPAVADLVSRALSSEPAKRPTAAVFCEALRRV